MAQYRTFWKRVMDLNHRPSAYGADELPLLQRAIDLVPPRRAKGMDIGDVRALLVSVKRRRRAANHPKTARAPGYVDSAAEV